MYDSNISLCAIKKRSLPTCRWVVMPLMAVVQNFAGRWLCQQYTCNTTVIVLCVTTVEVSVP